MTLPKSKNITWHGANVTDVERQEATGQRGCVVWFTGLSGSGKSTVTRRVEQLLLERGKVSYALDGDNMRHGLNSDLGFSPADRTENIRRIGEVAKLFADATVVTTTAFISPYRADRDQVRSIMPAGTFIEVFVDAPLEVCEERDPKGLYKKARAGIIPNFTGISAPYEAPEAPEIVLETHKHDVDTCAMQVLEYLEVKGFLTNGQ
ncbi:MAG: adenylyl-sulfate kinase [Alphaproteobacteria bacterium]|nr:adenylyl-sulfate kinase [Alphaproteobacteria bacterium]